MNAASRVADPDHLTDALRRTGTLDRGRVTAVKLDRTLQKLRSSTVRLHLTYDGGEACAPTSLFMKCGRVGVLGAPQTAAEPKEVAFYHNVAPLMPPDLVPRCFEATWQAETGEWHLLLEDLTESHAVATPWPLPPTATQCETILRARARMHAAWWDDRRLGSSVGRHRDTAAVQRLLHTFEKQFASFVDRFGEIVLPDRLRLFERLIDQAPRLAKRFESCRNLTLIHGDAHVWNCLIPHQGAGGDVKLIDWEDWRPSLATDDLAYMMAVH